MISAGVLILLFVVYQLWGTGIRTDSAQDRLRDEFKAKQEEVARTLKTTGGSLPGEGERTTTTTPPTTPSCDPANFKNADGSIDTAAFLACTGSTVPPGTTPTTEAPAEATPAAGAFPAPRPGAAIGQIAIPKIGADFEMVEGVDLSFLAEGPGHFPGTPFPGQPGNAALAGHRTTWKAPFNRIDELVPGDKISITTLQGDFTYEVIPPPGANADVGYHIIGPNQTEILDQKDGANTLTLMACHPKYSAAQRIVVVAKLVGNPAPATEKSIESKQAAGTEVSQEALFGGSGGDLVGGDPESQNSALSYGGAAALIWFLAWLLARRWRSWKQWQRWTVYDVALPIFLVPLFLAFENINRLLPAGY
jgi:sortase A